jgi:hypothetical protein
MIAIGGLLKTSGVQIGDKRDIFMSQETGLTIVK